MNDDPEHGAQEPFFLGEAAALYDTKAGEAGITYAWELGDQETIFGRMCNNDVVLDIIKYEPVKVGSNLYERTAKRFPVYVESICVRNVRLEAVGNKVKLAQGESNRILLAVPRETWFYREMASRPWDPRLIKAGDIEYIMQVSQQLLNKSLCPSFVFCHSSVSYTCVLYLQLSTSRLRTATMQVSKDTPDELAALTKPLEPVAKRVPKKQLKEKVSAPRTHAMTSRRSGACTDFMSL
jgi:hypothetical protein